MTPLDPLRFRIKLPGRDTVALAGVTSISYRVKGLLHVEADTVTLEWAAMRKTEAVSLTEVVDEVDYSPIASVEVPLRWITDARVTGGWWAPRLRLRARELDAFRDVPGVVGDALVLRIDRRDRELARSVAAAVERGSRSHGSAGAR